MSLCNLFNQLRSRLYVIGIAFVAFFSALERAGAEDEYAVEVLGVGNDAAVGAYAMNGEGDVVYTVNGAIQQWRLGEEAPLGVINPGFFINAKILDTGTIFADRIERTVNEIPPLFYAENRYISRFEKGVLQSEILMSANSKGASSFYTPAGFASDLSFVSNSSSLAGEGEDNLTFSIYDSELQESGVTSPGPNLGFSSNAWMWVNGMNPQGKVFGTYATGSGLGTQTIVQRFWYDGEFHAFGPTFSSNEYLNNAQTSTWSMDSEGRIAGYGFLYTPAELREDVEEEDEEKEDLFEAFDPLAEIELGTVRGRIFILNDRGELLTSHALRRNGEFTPVRSLLPDDFETLPSGSLAGMWLNENGQILLMDVSGSDKALYRLTPNNGETITVNDKRDLEDPNPDDDFLDIDPEKEGEQISLRAAIEYANRRPGLNKIRFRIEPFDTHVVIEPETELPKITDSVEIDGRTQHPSAIHPPVEISGAKQPVEEKTNGLVIEADDCVVRGLTINGFHGNERDILRIFKDAPRRSAIAIIGGENNLIELCYLGTNETGTEGKANEGYGVLIDDSPNNKIRENLISGNWAGGILVRGITSAGNEIVRNKIGTDWTGAATRSPGRFIVKERGREIEKVDEAFFAPETALGNCFLNPIPLGYFSEYIPESVVIAGVGLLQARECLVKDNIIAGNNFQGLSIVGNGANRNLVEGNTFGRSDIGQSRLMKNLGGAINVEGASNVIGTPGGGNTVDGEISLYGDTATKVQNNFIFDGAWFGGISIGGVDNNSDPVGSVGSVIGGTLPGEGNIIVDSGEGIRVAAGALKTRILGNYIGEMPDGTVRPNKVGIRIVGGEETLIGGDEEGAANTIASNRTSAIIVANGTRGHSFLRNRIYANEGPAIDLTSYYDGDGHDGFPDFFDSDSGGNDKTNSPSIESVTIDPATGGIRVVGVHRRNESGDYRFDIYERGRSTFTARSAADRIDLQGRTYLGTFGKTASGILRQEIEIDDIFPISVAAGTVVTFLATDPNGSTSEFSEAIVVEGGGDADNDGSSADTEDRVSNRGQTVGFGDGNGDGIMDSLQANVASFPSTSGAMQTLALASAESGELRDVTSLAIPVPEGHPGNAFPQGFLKFDVFVDSNGESVVVDYYPPVEVEADVSAYFVFGAEPLIAEPHWLDFKFDGSTGSEILEDRIRLTLIDGGRGDADGIVNGVITLFGGPVENSNRPPTPSIELEPNAEIVISWPHSDGTEWMLQESDDLIEWLDVTSGMESDFDGHWIQVTTPDSLKAYRLKIP